MSDRVHLSLDDESSAILENLEDDIENIYGSKSEFFQQALMEYDEQSRLKAKKKLLQDRINHHKKRINELKDQKKGVEAELEEVMVEKEEEIEETFKSVHDSEFWSQTVEMIGKRRGPEDPKSVEKRFEKYFESRYNLYINRFDLEVKMSDFK